MNASFLKVCLGLITLTSIAIAKPQQAAVVPFTGTSVHPDVLSAARDTLSIYLGQQDVNVVDISVQAGAKAEAVSQAVAAAGGDFYIRGRITRLGQRALIQVKKFKLNNPTPVFTDMMTAATPSDIETVMQRLARSIVMEKKDNGKSGIHTVTERESRHLRRRNAHQNFGLSLGGAFLPSHGSEILPTLGLSWLFDNRNFLFTADARLGGMGSDYSYAELSLGALYPLADDDTTPYLGGGLSLSGVHNDVDDETDEGGASGLGLYASAGVILGRSSSVSIRPELSYLVTSYEVNDALVHGLRFSLSLGF